MCDWRDGETEGRRDEGTKGLRDEVIRRVDTPFRG